jgi:hypothetical protein
MKTLFLVLCCSYAAAQDDFFDAAKVADQAVQAKVQEIMGLCEDEALIDQLNATYPDYMAAQKTLSAAGFLKDLAASFEEAGVTVEGFTLENACKLRDLGVKKLNELGVKLDALLVLVKC